MSNLYPHAGGSQPEVKAAVARFRTLPARVRSRIPLLYWLLGEGGTPPYKMTKASSDYGAPPPNAGGQICGNCRFAYARVVNGQLICSQIEGDIGWGAWCKLWVGGGEKYREVPASWHKRFKDLIRGRR